MRSKKPDNKPRRRLASTLLVYMLIAATSSVILAISAGALQDSVRYSNLVYLAQASTRKETISDQALDRWVSRLPEIVTSDICRTDIVNAGMRLLLLDIDRTDAEQDPDLWQEKLGNAERYLRHALSCSPQNGDVWLRLAMVRYLRYPFPEEVAHLVSMSQMLAPSDGRVMLGRFALWQSLTGDAAKLTEALREKDRTIMCGPAGRLIRWRVKEACEPVPSS